MVIVSVELLEGLAFSTSLTGVASQGLLLSAVGAFNGGANNGSMTNKTSTRMSLFMAAL